MSFHNRFTWIIKRNLWTEVKLYLLEGMSLCNQQMQHNVYICRKLCVLGVFLKPNYNFGCAIECCYPKYTEKFYEFYL